MNRKYAMHKTLGFVVEIEEEYKIKMDETWINVEEDELKCYVGNVVYDPKSRWGVGYKGTSWAADSFRILDKEYILTLDLTNNMFEVFVLSDGVTYFGGWYKDEIEWDEGKTPVISVMTKIEIEILSKIS